MLLVLISGGGSALLTAPAEGLSLEDVQATTREVASCGASIQVKIWIGYRSAFLIRRRA